METTPSSFKVILSDCHLSAGRVYEGRINPHEDFVGDDEMAQLIQYFSTDGYGNGQDVELILNGDFFDFLNVPFRGEFEEVISEEISLHKAQTIINAHPKVMAAIRTFASQPGKRVTYLIGNHDADLFYEKVRRAITEAWDPEGRYPSPNVQVLADRECLVYEDLALEVHHGNQFESTAELDFDEPFYKTPQGSTALKLPWSSYYVLKIVNRLKWERQHIDRIRPIGMFLILGLLTDPWFTLRFAFLSVFYFVRVRLLAPGLSKRKTIRQIIERWKVESTFVQDLEVAARQLLDTHSKTQIVVFGHTHGPMHRVYPDGKQYINTGTWTKFLNLDWRSLGQQVKKTFCLVRVRNGKVSAELRHWIGEAGPHQIY